MALFECNVAGGGGELPTPTEYNRTFTTEGWFNVKNIDTTKDLYFILKIVNDKNESTVYLDKFQYVSSKNSAAATNIYTSGSYQVNIRIQTGTLQIGVVGVPVGGYKIYFKEYDMTSLIV